MRILLVTTDYLPNVSGIATLSHEQAVGLAGLGHEVEVLTTTAAESFDDTTLKSSKTVRIVRKSNNLPPVVRLAALYSKLNHAIGQFQPDFIWCTNYRGFGLPVHLLSRKHLIPYGIYFHGTELITEARSKLRKRLLAKVAGEASVVCTNSKNSASLLLSMYHVSAAVATPGVHMPPDLRESADISQRIRNRWFDAVGRPQTDATVFIAACRVSRQKGLHVILEALGQLEPPVRNNVLFVAVGSGPDLEELKALSERLNITTNVYFHGRADRTEISSLLRAADVYLQPSQPEGDFLESFGISFLEAQAVGLPCIATKWGGIPEAVREGETALLVEPCSVEAVADAIGKVSADAIWRASASAKAVVWAQHNSWSSHAITIESQLRAAKPAFSYDR